MAKRQTPKAAARNVTSRNGVRILHANDPYNLNSVSGPFATGATEATFAPEAQEVSTENANPLYDPSKAPGNVQIKAVNQPEQSVSKGERTAAERTHGKVLRPNRQTLFGGKTLRRK